MFGCVVAGRPIITELQTISPTQFAFNIPSQPSFSHLVVFLLPGQTLSPGSAAAVHIQIPPSSTFQLLGAIANDKPSAIFRVNSRSSVKSGAPGTVGDDVMVDDATSQPGDELQNLGGPSIILGISVEPADNVRVQLDAVKNSIISPQTDSSVTALVRHQQPQPLVNSKVLAQRIIQHAFNYLSSFAGGSAGSEVIPLKSFQDWWTKFEKRIELDPGFLEKQDQV